MDRTLVVEFPWLSVTAGAAPGGGGFQWNQSPATDTREIGTTGLIFVQEMKLDLSGYTQNDLTLGFRRSFEQNGGSSAIFWDPGFNVNTDSLGQQTIISSVPINDAQLELVIGSSPGFTQYNAPGIDWGNFNRSHIIHGHYQSMYPSSIIGAGSFTAAGNAELMDVTSEYYSSLEPTAADCLYCYRVFSLPPHATFLAGGITQIGIPPKRVILDAFTVEEPDLEYMMRLKRSYELANQV